MKSIKRPFIATVILAVIIAGGWIYRDSTAERRNAHRIIAAIEDYRETHGSLPDSRDHKVMKRLGFVLQVGWHPEYEVGEKGLYRITILEGFDGPYWTYDSFSQMWGKDFPPTDASIVKTQAESGSREVLTPDPHTTGRTDP